MVWLKKTINGVPTKIPVSNPAPQGLPVGTILALYKKIQPRNCLLLDGRDTTGTADELETVYPSLYMYLGGTNKLPDYREVGLVGAEKNTTDIFDSTETDPRTGQAGTQNHDVFTQGEFKDDQVQAHTHTVWSGSGATYTGTAYNITSGDPNIIATISQTGRSGTVTRGKSKAVYFYIVAVDGTSISDEAQVIGNIKDYIESTGSYSTTEHYTGKKWIDGKKIWGCVFPCSTHFATVANTWTSDIKNNFTGLATVYPNIDTITLIRLNRNKKDVIEGFLTQYDNGKFQINTYTGWDIIVGSGFFYLEYTKTTD